MNDATSNIYKSFHSIEAPLVVFTREAEGIYAIEIANKKAREVLMMPQNAVSIIRRLDKILNREVFNQVRHHTEQLDDESSFKLNGLAFYIVLLEENTFLLQMTPLAEQSSLMRDINKEMLDNLSLLFLVLDRYGNIVNTNKFFRQLTRTSENELHGENYFSLFIDSDKSPVLKEHFLKSFTKKDFSAYYENVIYVNNSPLTIKWFSEIRMNQLTGEKYMFSFGRDITGEEYVKSDLKETLSILDLVLDINEAGYFEWDLNTNEIKWSPQVYKLLNMNPEEFTPSVSALKRLVHEEDRPYSSEIFMKKLKRKNMLMIRMKDGKGDYVKLKVQYRLKYDEEGGIKKMQGTLTAAHEY